MVRFYKNVACVLLIAMSLQAEGDRVDFPDGRIHLLSGGPGVPLSDAEKGLEFIVKSVNKCLAKEAAWPVWKKAALVLGVAGLAVAIYKNRHRFPRWRSGGSDDRGQVVVPAARREQQPVRAVVLHQPADSHELSELTPAQIAANAAMLAAWKEDQLRRSRPLVSPRAEAMRKNGSAEVFLRAINDPAQVLAFLNRRIQADVDFYKSRDYKTPVTDMLFDAIDGKREICRLWPIPNGLPCEYSNLSIARLVQICTGAVAYNRLLEPAREGVIEDNALLFGHLYSTLCVLTAGDSDEQKTCQIERMAAAAIVDAAMTAIAQHDYAGDIGAAKVGILARLRSNFPQDRKGRFPDAASRERAVDILAALSWE